jgi:hypothetical protein
MFFIFQVFSDWWWQFLFVLEKRVGPRNAADYIRVRTEQDWTGVLNNFRETTFHPAVIEQREGEILPRLRLFVGQEPWVFYGDVPPANRRRASYTTLPSPQKAAKLKKFGDTLKGSWHGQRMRSSSTEQPSSSKWESENPGSRKKRGGAAREEFQRTD